MSEGSGYATTPLSPATSLSLAHINGSWNLLSWSSVNAAGAISYPYSEAATGRIIFDTANLRMSAFMMHPQWKQSAGHGRLFLSYSAVIELTTDAQHATVLLHHVDFASNPRMIDETLRRAATLEGDVLTLKTLTTVGRETSGGQHTLVWQRAPKEK